MKARAAALLLLSGCTALQERPEREADVLAEVRAYYADFSARDWDAFAQHFWPGATIATIWTPPGESENRVVTQTIPEFVAMAPAGPGSKPIFSERMLDARVEVHGDLAQVWATYAAEFGEPGDVATWRGIDAFTLMRHRGRWRIASLAFTAD